MRTSFFNFFRFCLLVTSGHFAVTFFQHAPCVQFTIVFMQFLQEMLASPSPMAFNPMLPTLPAHRCHVSLRTAVPPQLCCCAVLKVGATLLTTLIVNQSVWITGNCPTPRAREPDLHRPPSIALGLNFPWQPVCHGIHAQPRNAMEG